MIVRGDARHLPLPDQSVDLVITSPPYWKLRSYQDRNQHYDGQIGDEATIAEFVNVLIEATCEMVRCLKPSGSIFVNLGDSYTDKSLNMAPHRYAIAAVRRLGLILRAEICWSKPNGLPESVTDRVRRSHEFWFHFTLQPRYYSAIDTIREPYEAKPQRRFTDRMGKGSQQDEANPPGASVRTPFDVWEQPKQGDNPLGKLPGSVWQIPSQPLTVPPELGVDHFAAFPMEWPRRIIQGWSPSGICTSCGEGRRPVSDVGYIRRQWDRPDARAERNPDNNRNDSVQPFGSSALRQTVITGEVCACPDLTAPTQPATVLDPFGGTGTTALLADVLGRHGISVDMSADYNRLARWRTSDPGQRAQAMQVDKPDPVIDGQLGLFEGVP
jgi:DNA modification methylase